MQMRPLAMGGAHARLRITNVPPFVDERELARVFEPSPGVVPGGARLAGGGVGFVSYADLTTARSALDVYNGWAGWGAPLAIALEGGPPPPKDNDVYEQQGGGYAAYGEARQGQGRMRARSSACTQWLHARAPPGAQQPPPTQHGAVHRAGCCGGSAGSAADSAAGSAAVHAHNTRPPNAGSSAHAPHARALRSPPMHTHACTHALSLCCQPARPSYEAPTTTCALHPPPARPPRS